MAQARPRFWSIRVLTALSETPMVKPQNRKAPRVPFIAALKVRGVCGRFEAELQDISRVGLRVRIALAALKLEPDAGIGSAASCVQTRVGSRFVVEFEGEDGRVALTRTVGLVRLSLAAGTHDGLDLGCAFESPLSATDLRGLPVEVPEAEEESPEVRQPTAWVGDGGPRIQPGVLTGAVDRLFAESSGMDQGEAAHAAGPAVRGVLRGASGSGGAPLLCVTEDLTAAAVVLRIAGDSVSRWRRAGHDAASLTVAMVEEYGDWPDLEIVDGAQRLWRGGARVSDIDVGDSPTCDIKLRLVLSRRLHRAELERMGGQRDS